MVQPIATTPSIQSNLTSQKLSWGTQLWRGLSIKWITNWKENILGVLAIYNLVYAIFLFFSGYWLTAGIALFTAGFCSATRKDIRDFTNLRGATWEYMNENKAHVRANMAQRDLNQKYKSLNVQHEQTNKEQQQITEELKERNRQLNENCKRFQNDLQIFALQLNSHKQQLRDGKQQLRDGKQQLRHLEGRNADYSRLNQQHALTLKSFDNRSKGLVTDLEKIVRKGGTTNKLALKGLLESLRELQKQRLALEGFEKMAEKKDDERLRILERLAKEVQEMTGSQLQTLDNATRQLQDTQDRLQRTTGRLEGLEKEVDRLQKLVPQLEAATRKNVETAQMANQATAGALSWMLPAIFNRQPSQPFAPTVGPATRTLAQKSQ